jgi:uncharacterized protein DUF397
MPPTTWRKSSFSDQGGSDCVEVAVGVTEVAVRDSKHPTGPHLRFPTPAWRHLRTRMQ